jgi:non-haem Fe2+, alpha-ketoglutarate-dependent halogenase
MSEVLEKAVAERGAFTPEEFQRFQEDGFAGPLDGEVPGEEIDAMRELLLDFVHKKSDHPLYGRYSVRDWHLIYPQLMKLIRQQPVIAKLRQIMGPDLTVWRSKVFHKKRPGEGPIDWHQDWGEFRGEEVGNDKPSLRPLNREGDGYWNITVWFPLEDIGRNKGPMQMVRGSYRTYYPLEMIPMVDSAFWHDPFIDVHDKQTLVERCRESRLVLDMDTSTLLDNVDVGARTFEDLKVLVLDHFRNIKAAVNPTFEVPDGKLVTFPIKKGQFIIFPERTMHRSDANDTDEERTAINFRVTYSSTLVYPERLRGDFVDSSNVNIRNHKNILLSGMNLNSQNVY